MLHWIAQARAEFIPPASREGAVLVDLGCGAGLLAPHVEGKGYRHVGIDLSSSALGQAAEHRVSAIRADVLSVPIGDGQADVVSAGEILEHVVDHPRLIAEACRILRPGGAVVIDSIASTRLARIVAVGIAERLPGGAPPGIHDPDLFVDRRLLLERFAAHGVELKLSGLRPSLLAMAGWWSGLRDSARMVRTRPTSVLFQGVGVKAAG